MFLIGAVCLLWALPAAGQRGGTQIEMNFRNVDMINFLSTMSVALGQSFVWDEKDIKGKITLVSPKKFNRADAQVIFETVLALHGYTTIKIEGSPVVQLVPVKDAPRLPTPTRSTAGGGTANIFLTQIIPLKFADANQVKAALTPLISKSAALAAYAPSNVILLSDTEANIARILKVIAQLDVAPGDSEFRVYHLKHASAKRLAPILTSLAAAAPSPKGRPPAAGRRGAAARRAGRKGGSTKVVAVEHTNSLVIVGDAHFQAQFAGLIEKLDIPGAVTDTGMKVYRLQHADAEEMKKILSEVKKSATAKPRKPNRSQAKIPDLSIAADKATNSLIVFGPVETIEAMDELVRQLDVRRAQVFVEALIIEMTLEKSLQLGVNWQATAPSGGSVLGAGSSGAAPLTLPQALSAGSGSVVGIIGNEIVFQGQSFASFSAFIQATRQDQDLNILANPQLLTLNNEEAEINVSMVVPISEKVLRDANQNVTTEFEFKDVGIILKITPQITGGDKVRLIISQESSSVASKQANLSGDQKAITTLKRTLKTKVLVDNNATIAIGGLIQDQQVETVTKVPCLGDIPVLGWFFKSRSEEMRKTNLIVFIRPTVITSAEDLAEVSRRARARFEKARAPRANIEEILKWDFGLRKEAASGETEKPQSSTPGDTEKPQSSTPGDTEKPQSSTPGDPEKPQSSTPAPAPGGESPQTP
ncbi:MAG: type II secretion system secretin GspD [bacterium]